MERFEQDYWDRQSIYRKRQQSDIAFGQEYLNMPPASPYKLIYLCTNFRIDLKECSESGKTGIYVVHGQPIARTDNFLGTIHWHGSWRKYVFESAGAHTILLDHACLLELACCLYDLTRRQSSAGFPQEKISLPLPKNPNGVIATMIANAAS